MERRVNEKENGDLRLTGSLLTITGVVIIVLSVTRGAARLRGQLSNPLNLIWIIPA